VACALIRFRRESASAGSLTFHATLWRFAFRRFLFSALAIRH
jgi:hypothetical protein